MQISGVLTVWHVFLQDVTSGTVQRILRIGLDQDGNRCKRIETLHDSFQSLTPTSNSCFNPARRSDFLQTLIPEMIRRELTYEGLVKASGSLSWKLLAWIELA